jgi:hypothetical protein
MRKGLGSNLDPKTDYPDGGFRGFPQYIQANIEITRQIMPRLFPSTSFPTHNSLIISPSDAMQSELLVASSNKPETKIENDAVIIHSSTRFQGAVLNEEQGQINLYVILLFVLIVSLYALQQKKAQEQVSLRCTVPYPSLLWF